jgi:hypothetical protein
MGGDTPPTPGIRLTVWPGTTYFFYIINKIIPTGNSMSQSRKFLGRSAMSSCTSAYPEGEPEFRLASRTNQVFRYYFTVALTEDSLYDVQSR